MGPTDRTSGHDSARVELLSLVRAQVEIRFSLTPETFADRILALPFIQSADPDRRLDQVARLVLDDLYLAAACADGDESAWREIERAHFAFIRDFAARFLHGAEAEDLAATVIADLWQRKKIAQFQGRSSLRTWLGAVVTRMALNAKTSTRVRMAAAAADISSIDPPAPLSDSRDDGRTLARLVQSALDGLGAEEKFLLLLHYEQGLSLDAMAPLVGSSKATLSRRLTALRDKLREHVESIAASEGGSRAAEPLGSAIERARGEFDLSALLGASSVKGGASGRV